MSRAFTWAGKLSAVVRAQAGSCKGYKVVGCGQGASELSKVCECMGVELSAGLVYDTGNKTLVSSVRGC